MLTNNVKKAKEYVEKYCKSIKGSKDNWELGRAGQYNFIIGEYAKSLQFLEKANMISKELECGSWTYLIKMAEILIKIGQYDNANNLISEAREIISKRPDRETGIKDLSLLDLHTVQTKMLIATGDIERANIALHDIKKISDKELQWSWKKDIRLSRIYFRLNNVDEGYRWLESFYSKTNINTQWEIVWEDDFENARKDSRYLDILKRLDIYEFWKNETDIKKLENNI